MDKKIFVTECRNLLNSAESKANSNDDAGFRDDLEKIGEMIATQFTPPSPPPSENSPEPKPD